MDTIRSLNQNLTFDSHLITFIIIQYQRRLQRIMERKIICNSLFLNFNKAWQCFVCDLPFGIPHPIPSKLSSIQLPYSISDELVAEKEKYRVIGDGLDLAFVEFWPDM